MDSDCFCEMKCCSDSCQKLCVQPPQSKWSPIYFLCCRLVKLGDFGSVHKEVQKKKRLHETMSVRPPSAAKKLESLLFKHSDDFFESGSLNFFCN